MLSRSCRAGLPWTLAAVLPLLQTGFARADWVALLDSPQLGRLSAFVAKSDGNFYQCKSQGHEAANIAWSLVAHGKPGQGAVGTPGVIGVNLQAFVITRTASGNVYARTSSDFFNNANPIWSWQNAGKPASATLTSDAATAGLTDGFAAFFVGSDHHLHELRSPGGFSWFDRGTPGVDLQGGLSSAYLPANGKSYVFAVGVDGQLYTYYGKEDAWSWASLGAPSGSLLYGSPAATSNFDDRLYAFVFGEDDHLYVRYWNGASWGWRDQGLTGAGAKDLGVGAPEAWFYDGNYRNFYVTWEWVDGGTFIFKKTTLTENWWSGAAWLWKSHSGAPNALLVEKPGVAMTFPSFPPVNVHVFAKASGDRVLQRVYSAASGTWAWATTACQY